MRCAIYARFSTDRQSQTSAEDQIRDCRARAEREGWTIVDVYSDLAISGASNRRPGLTALLADLAAGRFEIVLAEALDRLARDQADIATIYQRVTFAGARIETLSEGAINELHIGLKGTMGALFLRDLADKIRRGQRGAIARGRVPGGLAYGYEVVRALDDRGELIAGQRRIVPEQAAIVRRIMEEYVAGRSPKAIAQALNAEGIPSPRGREWRASTIIGTRGRMNGILANPAYAGRYAYNRVRMKRDPDTRNRVSRPNAAAEIVWMEAPELRIVDDALWEAVQDARARRAIAPPVVHRRPRHLLSGLMRCGVCGGNVTIVRRADVGCVRAREAGTCEHRAVIALAEVQRRVLGGLEAQLLSPDAVAEAVREYHHDRARRERDDARARGAIERRVAKAQRAIDRLIKVMADDASLDVDDVRAALARAIAERDAAQAALREVAAAPVIALHPRIADAYRARVRELVGALDGATTTPSAELASALRALIDSVVLTPRAGGGHDITVAGLLDTAIALATGAPPRRRGHFTTAKAVAEVRNHRKAIVRRSKSPPAPNSRTRPQRRIASPFAVLSCAGKGATSGGARFVAPRSRPVVEGRRSRGTHRRAARLKP